MDFSQFAMASFAIVGFINGVQFAVNKEWKSFIFFFTGVVAGVLFGYLGWFGLPSIEMGILIGLDASGLYKTSQVLGTK